MIQASEQFITAVTSESRMFRASLLCDGVELDCDISNIEIHKGASGEQVVPGSVYIPYMEFTVRNCATELVGKTIIPVINLVVDYDENNEPVYDESGIQMGKFIATKPMHTTDALICKAVGKLSLRGGLTYISSLTYPAALTDVINEIGTQLGMPIVLKGLDASLKILNTSMSGELIRDALGYIACILGGFVTEDIKGDIVISKYGAGEVLSVAPWRSKNQPQFAEEKWKCTGIKVIVTEALEEMGEDDSGEPITMTIPEVSYSHGTPNIIVSNPYMTEALFNAMYANIEGYSFTPGYVDMSMGDPRLEAWDCLVIEDLYGAVYTIPCLSITHKFHGGFESEVSGDVKNETEESAETTGPITKQLASALNDAEAAKAAADSAKASARSASESAQEAQELATQAADDAYIASQNASAAQESANDAQESADDALLAANSANQYALGALRNLSDVEKVVDVVTWISEHGTYLVTQNSTIYPEHIYYVLDDSQATYYLTPDTNLNPHKQYYALEAGEYIPIKKEDEDIAEIGIYYEISNGIWSIASEPVIENLSKYYQLDISQGVSNYVASHLALTDDGLSLTADDSKYRLMLAVDGMKITDPTGNVVGLHGETIRLGKESEIHFEATSTALKFCTRDEDICWFGQNSEGIWEMHIANTYVEDMMRYGDYAFIKRKNGNMSLKWLGE